MNVIRGNLVGTNQRPESVLERATDLTDEQKVRVRANIGAVDEEYVQAAIQAYIDEAILGGEW